VPDRPGDPDPKHISTSYVERQNLTMRMHMRRFTRLTNAFSKKFENHVHMVALYTVFYNFTKIHKTLRTTPALAAGLTDRVWEMAEMVALIDEAEMLAGRSCELRHYRTVSGPQGSLLFGRGP
jgi:hypothetical protein